MEREEEIKMIAYSIWEEEGYSHGSDVEHWLRAEIIWTEKRGDKAAPKQAKLKIKQTARETRINKQTTKQHEK